MFALLCIGLLSGLFFSSTFLLNRVMSLEGGHWVWSASLRYAFTIGLLLLGLTLLRGPARTLGLLRLFRRDLLFWVMAGSIGFGGFYALLCYSADHAPGWVIAATWQLTIIASLFVLRAFGRRFSRQIWLFCFLVCGGVVLINLGHAEAVTTETLVFGALPVLVAAFCYPIGNQLVWEAGKGHPRLPKLSGEDLENPFHKVLLLSFGSVPFWLVLVVLSNPPGPSVVQVLNTALVALLSGVVATGLFLLARNRAGNAVELAAVDATQSGEVVFALLGEMLVLGLPLPGVSALFGVVLVFAGLGLFVWHQHRCSRAVADAGERA